MQPGASPKLPRRTPTLMEALVFGCILMIVVVLTAPLIQIARQRSASASALNSLRQLTAANAAYLGQSAGVLPDRSSKGVGTWEAAGGAESRGAWFNALPPLVGAKSVRSFAATPQDFYTSANLLYLPGADYPTGDARLLRPYFAVAINSKLQTKGGKPPKLSDIAEPARTALFFEQRLPGENTGFAQDSTYTGGPKGSAKTFVGRYGGRGLIAFVDGHVEYIPVREVRTAGGKAIFPPTRVIWERTASEDPNKTEASASAK